MGVGFFPVPNICCQRIRTSGSGFSIAAQIQAFISSITVASETPFFSAKFLIICFAIFVYINTPQIV